MSTATPMPPRSAFPRSKWLYALGCGCGVLVVFVVAILSYFAITGGFTRMIAPGPFAGDSDFEVIVSTTSGQAEAVMSVLVLRLEELDVDVDAEVIDGARIRLVLHRVRDGLEVAHAILPVRALSFHIVAEDQSPLLPPSYALPEGVRMEQDFNGAPIAAADTSEALAPLLAAAPVDPTRLAVLERRDELERPLYVAILVEQPAALTGADVADASVEISEWDQAPIVMLHFTEDGGRRFADLTRANVQRKLAIVLDGESISSPVIQEAITGGSAQITMGHFDSAEELLREATAMSAALRSGALPAPCSLESVDLLH